MKVCAGCNVNAPWEHRCHGINLCDCPDCWPYKQPIDFNAGINYQFYVDFPGEIAAGLIPFSDVITINVQSGDPGGEEYEFVKFMVEALSEWYDGATVIKIPDDKS